MGKVRRLADEVEQLEKEVEAVRTAMSTPNLPKGVVRMLELVLYEKQEKLRRLRSLLEAEQSWTWQAENA